VQVPAKGEHADPSPREEEREICWLKCAPLLVDSQENRKTTYIESPSKRRRCIVSVSAEDKERNSCTTGANSRSRKERGGKEAHVDPLKQKREADSSCTRRERDIAPVVHEEGRRSRYD